MQDMKCKPCPCCGTSGTITVTPRLRAFPIGTHCVGGSAIKVNAEVIAVLECTECGMTVSGHLENAVLRGNVFVGGHFVADEKLVAA
jgi:hypothetical protein